MSHKLAEEILDTGFLNFLISDNNKIPLCGVLGGGYNKDFNKLVELHSMLHQSCAKYI